MIEYIELVTLTRTGCELVLAMPHGGLDRDAVASAVLDLRNKYWRRRKLNVATGFVAGDGKLEEDVVYTVRSIPMSVPPFNAQGAGYV